MKTIKNKTHRPLRVPLPRGKTLHLGPNKSGQIAFDAVDHPPLQKLVEAGEVELVDEAATGGGEAGGGAKGGGSGGGHTGSGAMRRSGDR